MRFEVYTNSQDTILPEWIQTERYMYCDNFVNDYMKSNRFSLLSFGCFFSTSDSFLFI